MSPSPISSRPVFDLSGDDDHEVTSGVKSGEHDATTVPPPSGASDPYSAQTALMAKGPAELLAKAAKSGDPLAFDALSHSPAHHSAQAPSSMSVPRMPPPRLPRIGGEAPGGHATESRAVQAHEHEHDVPHVPAALIATIEPLPPASPFPAAPFPAPYRSSLPAPGSSRGVSVAVVFVIAIIVVLAVAVALATLIGR